MIFQKNHVNLKSSHSMEAQLVKSPPTNAGDARDKGSVPGSGRSPVEGNGNLLQYSFLENSRKEIWWEPGGLQSITKS